MEKAGVSRKLIWQSGPWGRPIVIHVELKGSVPSVPPRPGNYLARVFTDLPDDFDSLQAINLWESSAVTAEVQSGRALDELSGFDDQLTRRLEITIDRLREPIFCDQARACLTAFLRVAGSKPIVLVGNDSDIVALITAVARCTPSEFRTKLFFSTFESPNDIPEKLAVIGIPIADSPNGAVSARERFALLVEIENPHAVPAETDTSTYARKAIQLLRDRHTDQLDSLLERSAKLKAAEIEELDLVAMLTPKSGTLPEFTDEQFLRLLSFEALAQDCASEFREPFAARLNSFVEQVQISGGAHSTGRREPTEEFQKLLLKHVVMEATRMANAKSVADWQGWSRAICVELKWFAENQLLGGLFQAFQLHLKSGADPLNIRTRIYFLKYWVETKGWKSDSVTDDDWNQLTTCWLRCSVTELAEVLRSTVNDDLKRRAFRQFIFADDVQNTSNTSAEEQCLGEYLVRSDQAQFLDELLAPRQNQPYRTLSRFDIVLSACWKSGRLFEQLTCVFDKRDEIVGLPVEWKARVFQFLTGLELSREHQPSHFALGDRQNHSPNAKGPVRHAVSGKIQASKNYTSDFVRFVAANLGEVVSPDTGRNCIRELMRKFFAGIATLDIAGNQTLLDNLRKHIRSDNECLSQLSDCDRKTVAAIETVMRFIAGEEDRKLNTECLREGLKLLRLSDGDVHATRLLCLRAKTLLGSSDLEKQLKITAGQLGVKYNDARYEIVAAVIERPDELLVENPILLDAVRAIRQQPKEGPAKDCLRSMCKRLSWFQLRRFKRQSQENERLFPLAEILDDDIMADAQKRFWKQALIALAATALLSAALVVALRWTQSRNRSSSQEAKPAVPPVENRPTQSERAGARVPDRDSLTDDGTPGASDIKAPFQKTNSVPPGRLSPGVVSPVQQDIKSDRPIETKTVTPQGAEIHNKGSDREPGIESSPTNKSIDAPASNTKNGGPDTNAALKPNAMRSSETGRALSVVTNSSQGNSVTNTTNSSIAPVPNRPASTNK